MCKEVYDWEYENGMRWGFTTSLVCNRGSVASAYWEATKNKYGAFDQSMCDDFP